MLMFSRRNAGSAVTNLLLFLTWLGLVALGALFWYSPPRLQLSAVGAASPNGEIGIADTASNHSFSELPALDTYDEIVERPLFFQARRPPEVKAEEPAPQAPVEEVKEDELILTGIMLIGDQHSAIILDRSTGKSQVAKAGASIGSWEIIRIVPDAVELRKSSGEEKRLALIRNQRQPTQRISQQAEQLRKLRERAALRRRQAEQDPDQEPSEEQQAREQESVEGQQPADANQPEGSDDPTGSDPAASDTDGDEPSADKKARGRADPPANAAQPASSSNEAANQQPAQRSDTAANRAQSEPRNRPRDDG